MSKTQLCLTTLFVLHFALRIPNHICADAITEEKYASVDNVVISFSVELAHSIPRSSGGSRSINSHITMLRQRNSSLMVIKTHKSQLSLLLLCVNLLVSLRAKGSPMSTRKIKQNEKSHICIAALPTTVVCSNSKCG